jgi:hypothetical protein
MFGYSPARIGAKANMTLPNARRFLTADAPTSPAQKGAATFLRHKDEQRANRLHEMSEQIAAGTLVVRQMTDAERSAASQAAAESRAERGLPPQSSTDQEAHQEGARQTEFHGDPSKPGLAQ